MKLFKGFLIFILVLMSLIGCSSVPQVRKTTYNSVLPRIAHSVSPINGHTYNGVYFEKDVHYFYKRSIAIDKYIRAKNAYNSDTEIKDIVIFIPLNNDNKENVEFFSEIFLGKKISGSEFNAPVAFGFFDQSDGSDYWNYTLIAKYKLTTTWDKGRLDQDKIYTQEDVTKFIKQRSAEHSVLDKKAKEQGFSSFDEMLISQHSGVKRD